MDKWEDYQVEVISCVATLTFATLEADEGSVLDEQEKDKEDKKWAREQLFEAMKDGEIPDEIRIKYEEILLTYKKRVETLSQEPLPGLVNEIKHEYDEESKQNLNQLSFKN